MALFPVVFLSTSRRCGCQHGHHRHQFLWMADLYTRPQAVRGDLAPTGQMGPCCGIDRVPTPNILPDRLAARSQRWGRARPARRTPIKVAGRRDGNSIDRFNDGLLTKPGLAFLTRPTARIYVQHKMIDNGAGLWSWLEEGASAFELERRRLSMQGGGRSCALVGDSRCLADRGNRHLGRDHRSHR
jgi:hypothetical protein